MTVQPTNVATKCPYCRTPMTRYPGYMSVFLDEKHRFSTLEAACFLNCPNCQPKLEYEDRYEEE